MKFSDIKKEEWPSLQPYLDTCLLPVTGLTGNESPVRAADRLVELRDLLDLLERPYRGRTVTYPAYHFTPDGGLIHEQLTVLSKRLREVGFRYIIVVTILENIGETLPEGVDMIITPDKSEQIADQISALWKT